MSIRVRAESFIFYMLHKNRLKLAGHNRICFGTVLSCKEVKLDYGARINGAAYFRGTGSVYIGRYSAIGQGLRILTSNHDASGLNMNVFLQNAIRSKSNHGEGRCVTIGPATWIGDGVTIVGADVGAGAIVGAGAVVTKNVEPFTVVAGNPAKVIKKRFSEDIISTILETDWWDHPIEYLKSINYVFEKEAIDLNEDDIKCLKNIGNC
jgi:virginiamycin A acetyltransferase